MEAVVFILVFVVLWAWIEIVRSKQSFREQLAALSRRIWTLEKGLEISPAGLAARHDLRAANAAPEPIHQPTHVPAPPPIPHGPIPHMEPVPVMPMTAAATPEPPVVHTPPPVPVFATAATPPPPRIAAFEPTAAPPPPPEPPRIPARPAPAPAAPQASFMEDLAGKDWESLIGGNLLNKVGALLLVIGIMSFLAYYGTRMGPAGRAGCSVLVSLSILGFGVWLERKETYRLIARSLIGAGWAALYATAYAIHAVPAARIIENPFLGSLILLLVAAGMIAHSLRYHAQGVTAVAFFSAFAALAITPSTTFAVLSLIPLAVAVLYLAYRFNWYHMALMGVFATYGACAWRGASGAPLVESESLFLVYWVLFEVFDLLRFSKNIQGWAVELIFPLNAAGFLGLSYASWTSKEPETLWILSAIAAALYLVSALWRVRIELASRAVAGPADLPARIRAGAYEAPLALAAVLTAAAIVQKLTGMWMSTALALEAQALFTAGIRFRSRFLRGLAVAAFAASLVQIAGDTKGASMIDVFGHPMHAWVFVALFHALLFYINRYMSEPASEIGIGFGWMGSLMVAIVLGNEMPIQFVGTSWMVFGAILFEFGIRKLLSEFRRQGYGIAFFGAWQSLVYFEKGPSQPWLALACGIAFTYAAAWRVGSLSKRDTASREWSLIEWVSCAFTATFATVLIIKQVPDQYAGVALWGLALVLLELGVQKLPARLRVFSYPVAALGTLAAFGSAQTNMVKFAPPQSWGPVFLIAAMAWIMSGRLTTAREIATILERTIVRSVLSGVGLLFALIAFWIVVPDEFVPAAWAAVGLAVLEAGNALDVAAYRWQAQTIAIIAALSACGFTLPDGHTHRIIAIALLIAVHVGFRFLSGGRTALETKFAMVHEVAPALLAASLIFQEVSGEMLTVAWGAEALALLGAGFVFRERPLRLEGLALFLVCVLKLFLYDLRNLDTPYRILSFIALGLILLGVSWIYTRFREQLQKLL